MTARPTLTAPAAARRGRGRPPGARNRTYAELLEAAKREVQTGQALAISTRRYREIREDVRAALLGKREMPVMPLPRGVPPSALPRRFENHRGDLGLRLSRIEQVTADQTKRLDKALEALERILRHRAAIARELGAIEPTVTPRHTRRRPLGT